MSKDILAQAETQIASIHSADNPAAVYLAGLAPTSRRVMENALRTILRLLLKQEVDHYAVLAASWPALRYQHTQAIRAQLLEADYSAGSVNRMLAALRGVLKECWRLGLMSAEDYRRAVDLKPARGETIPAGRDLGQGEILALVGACNADANTVGGIRDAAIIGLLYTGGLRRAELVALDLADINRSTGAIKVTGKGNKQRLVYAIDGAWAALQDWLAARGDPPGKLFLPVNKGGQITYSRGLTAQTVYDLLKRRAAQAGVRDFSPHDFRRTFVGDLLDRGVDIVTVQKMAGHASVTTTGRYDRRGEQVKQQAAAKLHFPYQRRRWD